MPLLKVPLFYCNKHIKYPWLYWIWPKSHLKAMKKVKNSPKITHFTTFDSDCSVLSLKPVDQPSPIQCPSIHQSPPTPPPSISRAKEHGEELRGFKAGSSNSNSPPSRHHHHDVHSAPDVHSGCTSAARWIQLHSSATASPNGVWSTRRRRTRRIGEGASHQHSAVQRVEVLMEASVLFIDDDVVHQQTWAYCRGWHWMRGPTKQTISTPLPLCSSTNDSSGRGWTCFDCCDHDFYLKFSIFLIMMWQYHEQNESLRKIKHIQIPLKTSGHGF